MAAHRITVPICLIASLVAVCGHFWWRSGEDSSRSAAPPQVTSVVAVYPSGNTIPENTLRLHVRFTDAMSTDDPLNYVRLYDGSGKLVEDPFLQLPAPLWDPAHRVLTLLFHPGRVKSGLAAHRALGRPLAVDQTVTVVVSAEMRDVEGRSLGASHRKQYRVTAAEPRALEAMTWSIRRPSVGLTDPAILVFDRPLDALSLGSFVRVVDSAGKIVPGRIELGSDERSWRFHPTQRWPGGAGHAFRIDPRLEDAAGNNLARPFDAIPAPSRDELPKVVLLRFGATASTGRVGG